MNRLPYLHRENLDDTGRAVWDSLTRISDLDIVNDDGGLSGPFNAFVHAPDIGGPMMHLGGRLRRAMSLDRRLLELAIITVGAHWKAEFEWWAHARMARESGVADVVVDAIGRGDAPELAAETDRVVYAVAHQLAESGRVHDDTYADAERVLGHRALVEVVVLCGYYTMISFILNAFAVPLPPGASSRWGG